MGGRNGRKRVAQACQRCRQRKFKCDGQKPQCSTCIQATQPCLYDSHIRRRGLPEGYVRGLELLAGLAIRHIDNFEASILSRFLQKDEEGHFEWHSNIEDLLDGWRNSRLSVELENLLPSLPSTKLPSLKRKFEDNQSTAEGPRRFWAHESTPQQTHHVGETPLVGDENSKDHQNYVDLQGLLGDNDTLQLQPPGGATVMARSLQSPETTSNEIKLPVQVGSLMRIYFYITHCWLPIVDKTEMMRSSYRYVNENPEKNLQSGSLALVWAITASTASHLLKSGHLSEFLQTENVSEDLVSSFYNKAHGLIPSEEGPFEIEHVQALLLLSLIKIDHSAWSSAWMLIGKAVRISIELDSTISMSRTDTPSFERHKKTFLGCFVLETLVAFYLSRPPHLRAEDSDRMGKIEECGLDEWDIWSNPFDTTRSSHNHSFPLFALSTFNRLVDTCKSIQHGLVAQLCGKPFSRSDFLCKLHKENMRRPFDSIFKWPAASYSPESNMLPHHYHLRLIYLTAVADLGPRPSSELDNETSSTQATQRLNCVAETRALIKELGERFGHNAIPQTCSLILAALSRSEAPIFNDPGHISLQPPIGYPHPLELQTTSENYSSSLQESARRDTGTKSDSLGKPADDGAVSQFEGELQQHSSLADSNSVFNDFVAIDTSEWTSNWEEGLFNLGFTADSSANDFYDFCEPNT